MLTPGIIRWASQRTAGPLTGLKEFGAFPRSWGKKYLLFTAIWPFRLKKLSQEALETMVEFLLSSPALPQVESGPGSATSPELLRKKKNPNKTPIEIINTASGKLLHLTKNPKTAKDLSVKTLHGLSPATEPGEQLLQNSLCFARIHQYSCPLISRASD